MTRTSALGHDNQGYAAVQGLSTVLISKEFDIGGLRRIERHYLCLG